MTLTLYSNIIKGMTNHHGIVKEHSMYNGQSAAKYPNRDKGSETKQADLI